MDARVTVLDRQSIANLADLLQSQLKVLTSVACRHAETRGKKMSGEGKKEKEKWVPSARHEQGSGREADNDDGNLGRR